MLTSSCQNFIPRWTWTAFMFKSELHYDVLRNKMNPELKKYVDMASMEMEYAWETDVPKPDGKQPQNPPKSRIHHESSPKKKLPRLDFG